MKLEDILLEKRRGIQERWLSCLLNTYASDARRFFRKQTDHFANPVGTTFDTELNNLLHAFLEHADEEILRPILDRILRVRAVQDFGPSQGLSFLFSLKDIVREVAEKEILEQDLSHEVAVLESRIDQMVLLAFEVYMGCRETLYELKADQMKNQVSGLLRRAGLISEIPAWGSSPEGGTSNQTENSI